jgi:hypothetical protein
MKQRVSRRTWYSPSSTGRRPRVLIEDSHPALEISDFAAFRDAGFDVAYCSGPAAGAAGPAPGSCPLLCGADCEILAGADVVLHGLDPASGVAADIRWWHPELPVVAKTDGPAPAGCTRIPACCSVKGQVEAVRRALPPRSPSPRSLPPRSLPPRS